MTTKFKLLTLSASLLACGIGMSGQAHANAYAVATNNISNGFVAPIVDGVLNNTGTFMQFGTPASESSTSATLGGSGVANSSTTPPPDAPVSTVGAPVRTNENVAGAYYVLFGQLASNYSWGDAKVLSEQSLTGTPIEARNAAESNIAGTGFANADGTNKSSTVLNIPIVIGGDCGTTHTCQVNFSFLADPYMLALLDAAANPGSIARSTLAMSVTLTKLNDLLPTFAWAPNGIVGNGIFGGTEAADAENLNLSAQALLPGQVSEYSGPYASNVFGAYSAITNALGTGQYTLSLVMSEKTDVKRIPEPTSLALLGLGMAGLGFTRRRKQA